MNDYEFNYIEEIEETSKTYRVDTINNKILGKFDDLEAISQAIYLRLSVEKYEHLIFSTDYGIQLEDLFGEPSTYVLPELQRRITEELLKDDRINDVDNFAFTESKGIIGVSFVVHTILGDIEQEMEVAF